MLLPLSLEERIESFRLRAAGEFDANDRPYPKQAVKPRAALARCNGLRAELDAERIGGVET